MIMGIKKVLERIKQSLKLNKHVKTDHTYLVEYNLLNINEDLDEAWVKINKLYDKILYKDKYWHLFYECEFSTLRCSIEYVDEVENFFKEHNIGWKYNGKWIDGSPTVEKYKDMYRGIFHEFSVLAIHLDEEDVFYAADRICHAFFNHSHYMAKKHREVFENVNDPFMDPVMWEADMMGRLATYRAHFIGRYSTERYYKKLSKEQMKDKSNDTDVE